MADLTDERLGQLIIWYGDDYPDTRGLLLELQRHRTAKAADAERIKAVVTEVARPHVPWPNILSAIATRVAEQLATVAVRLSEEEVCHLHSIRSKLCGPMGHLWTAELTTLDRLITAHRSQP